MLKCDDDLSSDSSDFIVTNGGLCGQHGNALKMIWELTQLLFNEMTHVLVYNL